MDHHDDSMAGDGPGHLRRRTALAGVAAATVMVISGGFLATHGIAGVGGAASSRGGLPVRVETGVSTPLEDQLDGLERDAALWRAEDRTLVYVSEMGYSSSCPPDGTARLTESGVVALVIRDYDGGGACTADAGRVTVRISGLTGRPSKMTVTALGSTHSIPVSSPNDATSGDKSSQP